jgi:hypothetical protein
MCKASIRRKSYASSIPHLRRSAALDLVGLRADSTRRSSSILVFGACKETAEELDSAENIRRGSGFAGNLDEYHDDAV